MLERQKIELPEWASAHPTNPNCILVDPDLYKPMFMELYGFETFDHFTGAVCHQSMKMDLQVANLLAGGDFGFSIEVRGDDGRTERWGEKGNPEGRGSHVANRGGKLARQYYARLRGAVPVYEAPAGV